MISREALNDLYVFKIQAREAGDSHKLSQELKTTYKSANSEQISIQDSSAVSDLNSKLTQNNKVSYVMLKGSLAYKFILELLCGLVDQKKPGHQEIIKKVQKKWSKFCQNSNHLKQSLHETLKTISQHAEKIREKILKNIQDISPTRALAEIANIKNNDKVLLIAGKEDLTESFIRQIADIEKDRELKLIVTHPDISKLEALTEIVSAAKVAGEISPKVYIKRIEDIAETDLEQFNHVINCNDSNKQVLGKWDNIGKIINLNDIGEFIEKHRVNIEKKVSEARLACQNCATSVSQGKAILFDHITLTPYQYLQKLNAS